MCLLAAQANLLLSSNPCSNRILALENYLASTDSLLHITSCFQRHLASSNHLASNIHLALINILLQTTSRFKRRPASLHFTSTTSCFNHILLQSAPCFNPHASAAQCWINCAQDDVVHSELLGRMDLFVRACPGSIDWCGTLVHLVAAVLRTVCDGPLSASKTFLTFTQSSLALQISAALDGQEDRLPMHNVRITRGPLDPNRSLPKHPLSAVRYHHAAGCHPSKWSSASRSNRGFFAKIRAGFEDNTKEEIRVVVA
ncbi:hypothetical protein BOTBODRAFT_643498 [Botryobasidium botryosum FD-172 SS1]|uniref:Uncharacterized protein n=1 Tax=Botryobasidium botryosum (strain FD-172 SS1) TaxID=930990 RepID=A0A067M077_BOTB1|nr:hypothetical protein BOTBODRAFT_643498 [Botryobasidium botryosum FD-172 SS1]